MSFKRLDPEDFLTSAQAVSQTCWSNNAPILETFFTSGPEESRAWTVKKNTIAPKAASVIHTDFEKNFIRAEAVTCEDFIKFGSAEKCKENGKLRIEGKDYIVKDGDLLYFRVNP